MPSLLETLTNSLQGNVAVSPAFDHLLTSPLPQTPEAFLDVEQTIQRTTAQLGDLLILERLEQTHKDTAFIEDAVRKAREKSSVPLRHKGWRQVSVLLLGGTKVLLKTPYLRTNWKQVTGKKRTKRGVQGAGCYPVLAALGITDRISPATRSEIALHTVQAASYQEAIALLERRGLTCSASTLERVSIATAQADITLRDAALHTAMEMPVSPDGPLAGLRIRLSLDGGRTRTRQNKPGRKTKHNRHRFERPWKEPRILVIDVLKADGSYDRTRLPLYDVLIADGDAVFSLLIGYLRLLGAAYAETIEFVSDGAEWIWDRLESMIRLAELPADRVVCVLDFYHAAEHLAKAIECCKQALSATERKTLFTQLRHTLRHQRQGVQTVLNTLTHLAQKHALPEMADAFSYFEKHVEHMQYARYDALKLPIGSGQVESAVRRVINLRFKAPGTFWKETTVELLLHLRAWFKAGRWDELVTRVIRSEFLLPSFKSLA